MDITVGKPLCNESVNYRIFGCNFRTTNARRPIKCSNEVDLKKETKNCHMGLGPMARWHHPKSPKPTPIITSPTRDFKPNTSHFFFYIKTTQLAGELWHLPKLAKYTLCGILLKNQNFGFQAKILAPEMLDSQPNPLTTWITALL